MTILPWAAIMPCRVDGVEKTVVMGDDGGLLAVNASLNQFVNPLSRQLGISVAVQKHEHRRRRGLSVRFGYAPENVFIQLKLAHTAGRLSYVRLSAVSAIFTDTDGCCTLAFTMGGTLHAVWKLRTVAAHLQEGMEMAALPCRFSLSSPAAEDKKRMTAAREERWSALFTAAPSPSPVQGCFPMMH